MILIGGTKLELKDLPFSDLLEYQIENNPSVLGIKLKTIARSSSCLKVYLKDGLVDIPLADEVAQKVSYFNSDDELLALLSTGGTESKEERSEENEGPEEDNMKVFSSSDDSESDNEIVKPSLSSNSDIEEVSDDLVEGVITIPNASVDIDSVRWQVELKQRIIEQKEGEIQDLKRILDDLYKLQEIELMQMKEEYEKRITHAEEMILSLKKKLEESVQLSDEHRNFLKFLVYGNNYKAILREGFTEEEKKYLGKLQSLFYIFACGSGDSLYELIKNVIPLVENKQVLLVDFTNDMFLNSKFAISSQHSSLLLNRDDVEVKDLVKEVKGVKCILTTYFNDIAFLTFDWAKIIKKLDQFMLGRPVILIFNNINNFSVRYAVSKLSTIGNLYVFAECNPLVLNTLSVDLAFLPEKRFKVVGLQYIDAVGVFLDRLANERKYAVYAFKQGVDWGKLGVCV